MSNRAKTLLLILVDALLILLALSGVVMLRLDPSWLPKHYELFAFFLPLWLVMFFIEGLYSLRTYNPSGLPISIIRGTFIAVVAIMIATYLIPPQFSVVTPKTNLLLTALFAMPLMYLWRRFFFSFFSRSSRLVSTAVFGSPETVDLVTQEIRRKPYLGYRLTNAITTDTDLIAIERHLKQAGVLYQQVFELLGQGKQVVDLASFAEKVSGKIPLSAIDESWFIEHCGHQESRSYDIVKNIFDKVVAVLLVLVLIPVAIFLLPILLVFHGRPVLFKQTRIGLNNRPFTLYKLRSMVVDAEKHGAQWAKPGDARVTALGKILRKTRLDELPQLINILRGEMSLVGPRPERPEMIDSVLAKEIPFYNLRHLVKPGVTGWAQVTFRYGFSKEDSKEKLQYDLYYVKNRTVWLDVLVILKTIKTVITGAGQ